MNRIYSGNEIASSASWSQGALRLASKLPSNYSSLLVGFVAVYTEYI